MRMITRRTLLALLLVAGAAPAALAEESLRIVPFVRDNRVLVTFELDDAFTPAVHEADASAARSGETLRQAEWRDELLRTGIRAKSGQKILFSRVEPLAGTRFLHAEAETKPNELGADRVSEQKEPYGKPLRVVIHFGPEHAPLEQRAVARAFEEASQLAPKPALVCPCHYSTFDPATGGTVLFGPAGRDLPQLPLDVDSEGYLVAAGDFSGPVGPSWWGVRKT